MNGCREVDPLLSAWIDRSLSSAERVLVGAHLSACSRCRAEVATLVQVAGLLGAIPCRALPAQLRGSIAMARPGDVGPAAAVHPAWMALIILALAGVLGAGAWVLDEDAVPGGRRMPSSPDLLVAEPSPRPVLAELGR